MDDDKKKTMSYLDLLMLILVLLFAFFIAFIPHIDYPFPAHLDEWNQLAFSQSLLHAGSTDFAEPFYGKWGSEVTYGKFCGYSLLLATIQQITGVEFIYMSMYMPGIIFMIAVLAVYSMARRKGFGWEAAFFTCLIPTTSGILGPAFMVPVAAGLLFIPLLFFLIEYQRVKASYTLFIIFSCFLILMHPPTAFIMLIIVIPYILFILTKDLKRGVFILVMVLIPYIFSPIVMLDSILELVRQSYTDQYVPLYVGFSEPLKIYGYIPLFCAFIGIIALIVRDSVNNRGLIISLITVLIMLFIFYQFHFGYSIVYLRGLIYLMLLLGIIAGIGLALIREIKIKKYIVGKYLYICIIIVVLIMAIPGRLAISYYKVIDRNDYNTFEWINDYVTGSDNLAVLDPWKATAFTAITNINIYSRIFPAQEPVDDMVYNFLNNKCRDTHFMEYNDITMVCNNDICDNSDLIHIRKDVYLFNQTIPRYSASSNMLSNPGMWEITLNNKPESWYTWHEGIEPDYIYPATGRNGGYCIGITVPQSNSPDFKNTALWNQSVPVEAGCTYILGGWVNTEDIVGNNGANIGANWINEYDEWIGNSTIMQYINGTHNWQYYEGEVTAPAGAEYCRITCQIVNSTGKARFDDILFMKK